MVAEARRTDILTEIESGSYTNAAES